MAAEDLERIQRPTQRNSRTDESMSRERVAQLVAEAIRRGELRLVVDERFVRVA